MHVETRLIASLQYGNTKYSRILFLVLVLFLVLLDDFALNLSGNLLVFSKLHTIGSTT